MIARATTTVSILRGDATNIYGDDAPTNVAVYTRVPMSIIEKHRRVFDFGTDTPRIVRYIIGRADPRTDIQAGDRLLNEKTGDIYMVDSFDTPSSPVHTADMQLDLRLVKDSIGKTATPRIPTS